MNARVGTQIVWKDDDVKIERSLEGKRIDRCCLLKRQTED